MKVFVTGATGAIGRFAVPALVEAGHEVTALARSDEKAAQVSAQGAHPARASLFDEGELKDAFAGCDAVLNLATSIPNLTKGASPHAWDENERIRREGSTAVVDAALAAGVSRVVQESITFTYPDCQAEWIDETVKPVDVPDNFAGVYVAERNAARFTEAGGTGVVLRFALFYGPGSSHTDAFLKAARRHIGAVAGKPGAYQSSIHLADAGTAVAAALSVPAGIYNVGDDEPLTKKAYATAIGAAVGKRPWLLVPGRWAAIGGKRAGILIGSQRVSNAKFKDTSGWRPAYPSAREGWKVTVEHA